MAKKTKVKDQTTKAKKPVDDEVPEGFEEVGDHWDEMLAVDEETPEVVGFFMQTAGDIGENHSNVHILLAGKTRIGVWGSILLDSRMACVKKGNIVMIRYMGKDVSEKSGREYKVFKVYEKAASVHSKLEPENDIPF